MKKFIRTDLAAEVRESDPEKFNTEGSKHFEYENKSIKVSETHIESDEAAETTGQARGIYITADIGRIWLDGSEIFKEKVYALADILRRLTDTTLPQVSSLLVAGLGNRSITADSIGPKCIENIIVTRHIKNEQPLIYENLGLFDISAISPGVLGQTGIESADILKSIVNQISPDLLIVIDALASRKLERLVTTVQLSTAGISPGSGVGNRRYALNEETLGCPVIAIGIPTVVDVATLAFDAVSGYTSSENEVVFDEEKYESIKEHLCANDLNFFVSPKESDTIMKKAAELIGYSVNLCFNKDLEYEEMLSLANA
ncbi:MAG: GPR endopeptidase [Ruminococcaceae bacterium]|nr:GPR endopeptidase [Oscillospiraceae bacterium]